MYNTLLAAPPKGISGAQLGRDLGTRQRSARLLLLRLRESWRTLAGPDLAAGPVGADGEYPGGREKNKHADKKGGGKKTAVVGTGDRETGIIRAAPVPETAAASPMQFVESNADPDSEKFTDENRAYADLKIHHHAVPPRRRGMRPGRGAHQRDGAVLCPGGARVQRDVPPHRAQAPAPPHRASLRGGWE